MDRSDNNAGCQNRVVCFLVPVHEQNHEFCGRQHARSRFTFDRPRATFCDCCDFLRQILIGRKIPQTRQNYGFDLGWVLSPGAKERVENNFPFSVARDSVASASSGLTTRRGCEFLAGWNERSAVPAEDMSITIRIAGTAQRLLQPTAGESKNSHTRRGCEFLAGWNERSAVPAEDRSITIRIARTAQRLFQPTAGESKNSHRRRGCEF